MYFLGICTPLLVRPDKLLAIGACRFLLMHKLQILEEAHFVTIENDQLVKEREGRRSYGTRALFRLSSLGRGSSCRPAARRGGP